MAESEFEYLKYTYAHNILGSENKLCDDQTCYCLDSLQLSLLLLILKKQGFFPSGTLFEFYQMVHIRIKECDNDILKLKKCNNERVKKYVEKRIYFNNAQKSDDAIDQNDIFDITLEKQAINLLATAIYMIIKKYNETNGIDKTNVWKDRNFDYILLDIEFLNPKLLLLVAYNMFYGFLLSFESETLSVDRGLVVDRYVNLLVQVSNRLSDREIRNFRKEIIDKYDSIFQGEIYNRRSYEERIARYMYGVTLEENRVEEVEILGSLDYLCAMMRVFKDKFLKNNTKWAEAFEKYIDDIYKVMKANITQDPMYLPAQYYGGVLVKLSSASDFKRALEKYCKKNRLFLVGIGSPSSSKEKGIKEDKGNETEKQNQQQKRTKLLQNIFKRIKQRKNK